MIDFLKDYKSEEISEWINEFLLFLIKPRQIVDKIFKKNKNEKLRQFFFHFTIYTASFIFLSIGSSISDWIKPAILNLFSIIPEIILFIISTRILSKKDYLTKILIFVIGLQFILVPLIIVVFTLFLNSENYTYKYIADILSGFSAIYLIFVAGFAIEKDNIKALKILGTSYLILNIFYFLFLRINVDPYSTTNFTERDPIYSEYYKLVEPLKNKEIIPTYRFVTNFNNKIETTFGVQEIISDKESKGSTDDNELYIKNLNKNIEHIEKAIPNIKFKRNQAIADNWLDYFRMIQNEVNYKIKDTAELKTLKLKEMNTHKGEGFTLTTYYGATDFGKIIALQIPLKWYNNSILHNHNKSALTSEISNGILLFLGTVLDYLVGDVILEEGAPKPYTEKFIELE
uniref:hypothetical protein n=1 Tax=Gelidibacter sp. TaxID=2018083 RepID=UPI00404A7A2E